MTILADVRGREPAGFELSGADAGGRVLPARAQPARRKPNAAQQTLQGERVDELMRFLYDLHLRAHSLPQDSFRRWLCTAVALRLDADRVWLVDDLAGENSAHPVVARLSALVLAKVNAQASMQLSGGADGELFALAAGELEAVGGNAERSHWQALLALQLPEQSTADAPGAWLLLARERRERGGRAEQQAAEFGDSEGSDVARLRAHLGLALALNRWEQRVRLQGPTSRLGRAHAVVDRAGRLLQADAEFAVLVRREFGVVNGGLPAKLLGLMRPQPSRRVGASLHIDVTPVQGGVWLWAVRVRHGVDVLSERQLLVVRMFADGRNYREIATFLGLAPSTVRRHLQTSYARLGVRTKIELARLLADSVVEPGIGAID